MGFTVIAVILICVFACSVLMTGIVRRYAMTNELIDRPNERSSHSIPTPRGGGMAITLSVLGAIVLLAIFKKIPADHALALGGGGLLVSLVGWLDDHYDIPAIWRALSYLAASLWAVLWVGGSDSLSLGGHDVTLPYLGTIVAALGIAWLTNLYNFMDGTDAIAAGQAMTTAGMAGGLFWMTNQQGLAVLCFILVSSSAGFLLWNWPPARIFMGDIGSCLIGYLFGVLSMIGDKTDSIPIIIWFVLLSLFICDATLTLIRRILQGERWYSAHKTHAYQRLVQMGISHKQLAIGLILINILFLWPLALLVFKFSYLSIYMGLAVLIIMSILWFVIQMRFKRSHAKPISHV